MLNLNKYRECKEDIKRGRGSQAKMAIKRGIGVAETEKREKNIINRSTT
jgi:hypothetical protein